MNPLAFVLTAFLASTQLQLFVFGSDVPVLWNNVNCKQGNVTDLICCRDSHCDDLSTRESCEQEVTCRWGENSCVANRDADNNVCCLSQVSDICTSILEGDCPERFQVPSGCCTEKGMTYNNVLRVRKVGYVCCNTPCKDAKEQNCTVPDVCYEGIEGRSLGGGGYGPQVDYGFNRHYLPHVPYGTYLPYTGFEHRYHQLPGESDATVGEVNEITVDDLMTALVEALSNDNKNDAFIHSAAIHSSPFFGKRKFGGNQGSYKFVDPNFYINQIYGSPYSMSSGQFGFGGYGWPSVQGYYPQHVHTPYYGYVSGGYSQQHGHYSPQPQPYGYQSLPQWGYGGPQYGHSYRPVNPGYGYGAPSTHQQGYGQQGQTSSSSSSYSSQPQSSSY